MLSYHHLHPTTIIKELTEKKEKGITVTNSISKIEEILFLYFLELRPPPPLLPSSSNSCASFSSTSGQVNFT